MNAEGHLGVMTAAPVRMSVPVRSYVLANGGVVLFGTEAMKDINGVALLWMGKPCAMRA